MFYLVYTPLSIVVLAILIGVGLSQYGKGIPVGHITAAEIALRRSPAEVYDLLADVSEHHRWAPRVKCVNAIPPRDDKPAYTMICDRHVFTIVISAAEPNRAFALTIVDDKMFSGTWRWDITPTATGCTIRLTERGEISSATARALVRLTGMEAKFLLLNLSGLAKHFGETVKPQRVA